MMLVTMPIFIYTQKHLVISDMLIDPHNNTFEVDKLRGDLKLWHSFFRN